VHEIQCENVPPSFAYGGPGFRGGEGRGPLYGYRLPGALDKTPSVTERGRERGGTWFSG